MDKCNTSEEFDNVVKCINEKSFKLGDIVKKATSGDKEKKDRTVSTYWNEGLDLFQAGESFSPNQS